MSSNDKKTFQSRVIENRRRSALPQICEGQVDGFWHLRFSDDLTNSTVISDTDFRVLSHG